ncbi:SusC/RagA family TonB-linked outer membrane protein [Rubrolithibacter danxiaensis]|uniref:SusC/RagA family TonB-linked outer membrane protein n=1 Tax=Rubrolithibacter danxiaensis TaxID=3390805 RepID=UPI003BF83DD1
MRQILQKVVLLALFTGVASVLFAQDRVVKGTVSDEQGITLPGASVSVKDTKIQTSTDANGAFSINVPAGKNVITVSYIGMQQENVTVAGKSVVQVVLKESATTLNEAVVIGYGTIRRSDVTSSISSVSQKDIKNLPVAGIDQAIQGKVAGVSVTNNSGQPGGGVSVRVRGITSVNGNEPLYVIDGVPLMGTSSSLEQNFLGGGSGQTGQSVMATLNPADIESIDILKDASAQAIYGSRGANGVVLINTKKGKTGQGRITYDTYYGVQEVPKKLSVMNLSQYAEYMNSLVGEIRAAGSGLDSVGEFKNPGLLGHGTDWQDEIYQRGATMSHQLSFSGGSDKTTYYFSGGYFDQTGTLIETGFKRYTLRANIDQQVTKWLKAGFSTNLSRSNQKIGLSDGFDAVTSTVLYNSPATPVRDINGNFISQNVIGGSTFGNPNNPVALASSRDVRTVGTKAFGALYAEINILKGLTLRNEGNYDFSLTSDKAYQPYIQNPETKAVILSPSRLREQRSNSLYWLLKNYLNYNTDFGKHSISATAGHEVQKSTYDYINANRNNLVLNLPSLNAGDADLSQGIGAGAGVWSMESFFARGSYTYDNKYSVSGTIRRDGSSSFGPGKRWGTFPAGSVSWTASNEPFLKDSKYLNYLKLRLGYGLVGEQGVSGNNPYTSNITLFGVAPFGAGGLPSNVENPFLSWESVKTYNAGVDLTTLNNKLELTVDLYKKITSDMLLPTQLGAFSGLGTAWNDIQTPITNDGEMTNTGFDISLTSYNIQSKNTKWKTNFTFSHYKNILNRLNTESATIVGQFDEYGTKSLITLSQQSKPVGSYYGYVTDGLFRSEAELNNGIDYGLAVAPDKLWLGDIRYKDLNGDGKIDDKDVTTIGNPNPKFTFGMTNTVNWKNFDLSVFLYGSYGADIFNYTRRQTESLSSPYNNQLTTVLGRYTESNPNGTLPRYNQWSNNNLRISDRFIEDGSYLRIQNVALGYNLPKSLINKAKVSTARIYASVQNLYTFTNYSGYDPELGALNNSVTFMNVDNGHYPIPRTFTIGANIEF